MLRFEPVNTVFPEEAIYSAQDFENSAYAAALLLLNEKDYRALLFTSTQYDETTSEAYYFLQGNGTHLSREENMLLVEIDEVRFVLIDFEDGDYVIVTHKNNIEFAENLL